jgi:hypothetical protein
MKWKCEHCGLELVIPDGAIRPGTPISCFCGGSGQPVATVNRGPGAELSAMLAEIGVSAVEGCGCEALAAKMNLWGADGCREKRQFIARKLKQNAKKLKLAKLVATAFSSATASWVGAIKLTDPWGSLVDEAIRRAEEKESAVTALASGW